MKLNQKNRVSTPFGDFQIDVENLVDQLFDRKPSTCSTAPSQAWTPRVSVMETGTSYDMVIELPGVDPSDVNLEMQEGRLEISGVKKISELAEGVESIREERQQGEFKRLVEFSKPVEPDGIKAEFKNGLLTIMLPKSEKALPRKIEIQVEN